MSPNRRSGPPPPASGEDGPVKDVRKTFHQLLEEIRADILRLAGMVTESIPRGTQALLDGDLQTAQSLIDGDDELDALSLDLEDRCYQLLALQQPMASDLRSVVAAIRMISEIERSGDLVVNIVKAARRIYGVELPPRLRGMIQRLSESVDRIFRLAMDSYAERDADLAAALDDMDDTIDALHAAYIAAIFETQATDNVQLQLQPAVQLALVGRYYERIADHAVNIGERVRYMVTGWKPEHVGAARLAQRRAAGLPTFDDEPGVPEGAGSPAVEAASNGVAPNGTRPDPGAGAAGDGAP